MASDEEDDYLTMTFDDPKPKTSKETSLQRTTRLKKEAAERGNIPSKAERQERERQNREAGLSTQLDDSNKGAQMLAKMGFKGGALGKSADGRTQPVELQMKDDRGGIGMESEKKRKIREAAELAGEGEKRRKVGEDEFRERHRAEREERRAEGQMWGAMKVLEGLEADSERASAEKARNGTDSASDEASTKRDADGDVDKAPKEHAAEAKDKPTNIAPKLREVNLLYRPLLKQRLERDRDRKMRHELNNSLSTRNDDDDDLATFDDRIEDLEDEDDDLAEFEALPPAERRDKVIAELRGKYYYCFWCKFRYPGAELDGCPGVTEDEHG